MKMYLEFLKELLDIDSPSGYTDNAVEFVKQKAEGLGYKTSQNKKGNLHIHIKGNSDKTIGLAAHIDTLGLMVTNIKKDGTLAFTNIGGPILPTLDGEYCRIITRDNKIYTGTILSNSPAMHVYSDCSSLPRTTENMHIRIDEIVKTKEDVEALGITNGDFIAIDTKTTFTDKNFIKSRFLDDKLCVACFYAILQELKEKNITPKDNIIMILSTYEEVGFGASNIPSEVSEVLAVDMGCIGEELSGSEYTVSICAKDARGPYDYNMTSRLIQLAKDNNIDYCVDVYPFYASDVTAALVGGNDICGGLIGPGVHASHGMERAHQKGVDNTIALIMKYITS